MFFTRLGRAWLICRNNVLHHIRFFIICSVSQVFQMDFCSFTLQTYLYDITLFLKMQLSLLSEKMFFLLKQNISPVVSFLRIVLRCPERKYLFTIFVISQSFLFSCKSSGKAFFTSPEHRILPLFKFSWKYVC